MNNFKNFDKKGLLGKVSKGLEEASRVRHADPARISPIPFLAERTANAKVEGRSLIKVHQLELHNRGIREGSSVNSIMV